MIKRYMIHVNGLSPEETTQYQTELHQEFGEENVFPLEDKNLFVVQTDDRDYFSVMARAGFTDQKDKIGFIVGIDNTNINGRYYVPLWDFINQRKHSMSHVAH